VGTRDWSQTEFFVCLLQRQCIVYTCLHDDISGIQLQERRLTRLIKELESHFKLRKSWSQLLVTWTKITKRLSNHSISLLQASVHCGHANNYALFADCNPIFYSHGSPCTAKNSITGLMKAKSHVQSTLTSLQLAPLIDLAQCTPSDSAFVLEHLQSTTPNPSPQFLGKCQTCIRILPGIKDMTWVQPDHC